LRKECKDCPHHLLSGGLWGECDRKTIKCPFDRMEKKFTGRKEMQTMAKAVICPVCKGEGVGVNLKRTDSALH